MEESLFNQRNAGLLWSQLLIQLSIVVPLILGQKEEKERTKNPLIKGASVLGRTDVKNYCSSKLFRLLAVSLAQITHNGY